jgi:ABC-type glycerol-3-phosphate transport system substrate-binding protein
MKRISMLIIILVTLTTFLVGCNLTFNKEHVNMIVLFKSDVEKYSDFKGKLKSDKNISLNIDYLMDDLTKEYFDTEDLWSAIEMELSKKLKKSDTDIIANIPTTYLYKPIENNQLESFSSYLNKEKNNFSNIYAPIINISKKVGSNEIFFLSPSFNNKVLIINNDIFNKLNIEIPNKQLTWSEIYDLSLQIQSKSMNHKEIYPISLGPAGKSGLFMDFELLTNIKEFPMLGESSNVYPDEKWSPLLEQFIKLFQTNGNSNELDRIDDMFFEGKVGFKILYPIDLNILYGKYSYNDLGFHVAKFNYSIIPAPVFEDNRDITYIDSKNLAISKKSKKKDLAWKTVEYAMSKEYALFMANSERNAFDGKFTSYQDEEILKIYAGKYKGINPNVFYSGIEGATKPEDFTEEKYLYYHELVREYFPKMIDNELTIEQGIKIIKEEFKNKFENK